MVGIVPSSHELVDDPKGVAQHVRAAYANHEDEYEMAGATVAKKWQGTDVDRRDMSTLGKVQELRVSPSDIGPDSWGRG